MGTAAYHEPQRTAPFRVLVVDDEKNIRITLSACLEGMGCRVTAMATASDTNLTSNIE